MWNIAKSQLYQIKKSSLTRTVFILVLALYTAAIAMRVVVTEDLNDGAGLMIGEIMTDAFPMMTTVSFIFIIIVVSEICCSDYGDKTANYEIMSGHRRLDSYFGRVIPCLSISIAGYILLTLSVVLVSSAIVGWGEKLDASEAFARWLMTLFPVMRITSEFIMLAFICRKSYILLLAGYITFMGESMMISELGTSSHLLGLAELNALTSVDTWQSFGLKKGSSYFIYDASLTSSECILTIVCSLAFTAAALFLGYVFFKNDDLN